METITKSQLKRIFTKHQFSEDEVQFISELVEKLSENQEEQFLKNKDFFLNKNDKIELIEKINEASNTHSKSLQETRSELLEKISDHRNELSEKIWDTRIELLEKINEVRKELLEKINEVRNELLEKINSTKIELIRWVIGIGFLQLIAIVGALLAIVKLVSK